MSDAAREALWIFGYGSLVWRPDFPFEERRAARLRGWARRFWQGSTDHRGIPGAPGRVVTLVEAAGAECAGIAYRVADRERAAVLAALDHREQGGYRRHRLALEWLPAAGAGRSEDSAPAAHATRVHSLVYVATPDNPNHLGPVDLAVLARQVATRRGPSGTNAEYVLRLADAIRSLGAVDAHVFEVEAALREELAALGPEALEAHALIRLRGLSKRYRGVVVVDALDLEVERGELLALVGASGCGKTTTLKMINRLVEPTAGSVEIDGRDTRGLPPHELRRRIGYGFQQVGLFPHMSVARNVGVVPSLLGWDAARIDARVDELLELVRLEPAEFRERRPSALSGGQAQRVGLARALAAEPEVVLLDEPFGALDPATRDHLQQELTSIRHALGLTIVFVTHDMSEALLLADRIAVLREGRLVQHATPERLLAAPADDAVAALIDTPRRQARAIAERMGGAFADRTTGASELAGRGAALSDAEDGRG